MYAEDALLPISALQHLAFCERQWALIHLEQQWAENLLTAEGRVMHERTHGEESESQGNLRIVRGLRVRSLRYGLVGVADTVEFVRLSEDPTRPGVRLPNRRGRWQPKLVEYKRGRPKPDNCDLVQLCAQTFCLEEMLSTSIPAGAIFYGRPRRRLEVAIDADLRRNTEALCERLHRLHQAAVTPPAVYEKKCRSCSLRDACQPEATASASAAGVYLDRCLREIETITPDGRNTE